MLLLSCTSCSAFLILLIWRSPKGCLKKLGTEYVQLWSTLFYQGAHTPKQEGRECVKRGWNSPKASAFQHNLLSIPNYNYDKQLRIVIGSNWNWVCTALEHFPLPWCTCQFPVVWQVIIKVNSFSAAAFLHILLIISNHNYNEESRIVLVWTRHWGMHF